MKLFQKKQSEKKHKHELKRKEKREKIKKYNLIMGIVMSQRPTFRPHPIQRTQKQTILSVWREITLQKKSKQFLIEGYVK
jgi:hypothetical protein